MKRIPPATKTALFWIRWSAGNVHDSVAFDDVYDKVTAAYPEVETIVADSAYKTPISADCIKTVQRHIWKDYEELADNVRYTPEYRDLYARRKETIERVFADAKEKHAMRYTQYRGLARVTNWVKLKFAAMNLKKWQVGNG